MIAASFHLVCNNLKFIVEKKEQKEQNLHLILLETNSYMKKTRFFMSFMILPSRENKAVAYTRIYLRFADDCREQESSISTSNAFSAIDASRLEIRSYLCR